jgi:hypothetical protein
MINYLETGGNILEQSNENSLRSNSTKPLNNEPDTIAFRGQYFEIRIKGQLSNVWTDWFEGLTVTDLENGEMLLSGYILDQSALMGIMDKLVRLNLPLISLNEIRKTGEEK